MTPRQLTPRQPASKPPPHLEAASAPELTAHSGGSQQHDGSQNETAPTLDGSPSATAAVAAAPSEVLPGIQLGVWTVTPECSSEDLEAALNSKTPHLLLVTLEPVDERTRTDLRETFKSAVKAADRECKFAGVDGAEGSAVAVVWKNTDSCKPDVEQLECICDASTGIPAVAAAFKVTIGKTAHIVAAVSRASDGGWTDDFSKNLRKLMLENKVRWLGVHSSGLDKELADEAAAVFANVVNVQVESQPLACRPKDGYDEARAAVAAAFFGIEGSDLSSFIHAPAYLMLFGGAAKDSDDDVNYKIPGKKTRSPLRR